MNKRLTLATWNIHMGVGSDGKRDLERTARVIQHMSPDILGLQEVDNRFDKIDSDLGYLQRITGLEVISGPTMRKQRSDYGNALLTRLPILDVERFDISVPKREPRGLLIVHLGLPAETLQVAVTHLGLKPGERRIQVRRLLEILSPASRSPLILMGDLNEWLFFGRPLRWLRTRFDSPSTPPTFPAHRPMLRLDHILCHPPGLLKEIGVFSSSLTRAASDHLPLTCTLG